MSSQKRIFYSLFLIPAGVALIALFLGSLNVFFGIIAFVSGVIFRIWWMLTVDMPDGLDKDSRIRRRHFSSLYDKRNSYDGNPSLIRRIIEKAILAAVGAAVASGVSLAFGAPGSSVTLIAIVVGGTAFITS